MAFRRYNFTVNRFNQSKVIPRERNCNGYTITNIGDTALTVNGKILFPSVTPLTVQGDSISFGGNEGEIYIGYINLSFVQPVGVAPNAEVIQKFYLDDEK